MNPHQRRIGEKRLGNWANFIADELKILLKADDFDDLLNVMTKRKLKNIGEVTLYDTAAAFGRRIGKIPQRIYLHAGTKKGLKQVLPEFRGRSISKSELPTFFAQCDLSPEEFENFFCVFHKALNPHLTDSAFRRAEEKVLGRQGC